MKHTKKNERIFCNSKQYPSLKNEIELIFHSYACSSWYSKVECNDEKKQKRMNLIKYFIS